VAAEVCKPVAVTAGVFSVAVTTTVFTLALDAACVLAVATNAVCSVLAVATDPDGLQNLQYSGQFS
jgi:hypothetical protein